MAIDYTKPLKLKELTHEQQCELSYPHLCQLRREAYIEHVAGMVIPDEIKNFAASMEAGHGATIGVWRNRMPWVEALMVVRYGEEPAHWPQAFTREDVKRAQDWLAGETPRAVVWANKNPSLVNS